MRPSFLINTVRTGWPEDESGMRRRTNSLTHSQGGCIHFACRLTLCSWGHYLKNGATFWVCWYCSLILGCRGNHRGVWRDRPERQTAGCRSSAVWESTWRSFCRTKKADTHFGRANEAFDIQPKISVSLLLALLPLDLLGAVKHIISQFAQFYIS